MAQNVYIRVDKDGAIFWNGDPVTQNELEARLAEAASIDPAGVRVTADEGVIYQKLTAVLQLAQQHTQKVGYMLSPPPGAKNDSSP